MHPVVGVLLQKEPGMAGTPEYPWENLQTR